MYLDYNKWSVNLKHFVEDVVIDKLMDKKVHLKASGIRCENLFIVTIYQL